MCNKTFLLADAHGERNNTYDNELDLLDIGTGEKVAPHNKRSVSPQRCGSWRVSAMQKAWAAHFFITITVLICGAWHNNQR
jgi:hypothetical protein